MTNPLWDGLFASHLGSGAPFLHLEDGRTLTYGAFLGLAARYAHLFTEHGLRPRDRVAVQAANRPEALAVYAACVQTGLVFVPLSPACTPSEVDYFVSDSGAALLVGDPAAGALDEIASRYGARYLTLGAGGKGTLADLSAGPTNYPTVPRVGIDLAALLYTPGTTGRPKGVMLTQGNVLANALAVAHLWRFTADDVLLHALPLFHGCGLLVASVTLAAGGSMIVLPGFDVDRAVARIPQASAMIGPPASYARLLADERFDADLCRDVRLLVSGSTPMREASRLEVEARAGRPVLEYYAMTEAGVVCSASPDGGRRAGSVGAPLPGTALRIVDDGVEVPPGQPGILQVRGPSVFQGYWGKPGRTRRELSPDGWFTTGDLARMDDEGQVTLLCRASDLIVTDGEPVYPGEIEQVLDDMPGVLESCIIGVPDPDLGQAVVALLVPKGDGPDLPAIRVALASRLAAHERPRLIEVVGDLPLDSMGRVRRAELRVRFAQRLS